MPAVYGLTLHNKSPEDERQTPLVPIRSVTTAAGNAGGLSLIDARLVGLTDSPVQLTIVRRPDDPLRAEVRQASAFNAVTGEVTVGTAFSSQMAAAEHYAIVTTSRIGGLTLLLSTILQPVVVNGSVGPNNFFAGAIEVVSLTPTGVTMLGGLYLDINGFANGAILTATVLIRVGAANNQRQFQKTKTKLATETLWPIIDTEIPLKNTATTFVLQLQSNNAADVAVTTPFTYFTRTVA